MCSSKWHLNIDESNRLYTFTVLFHTQKSLSPNLSGSYFWVLETWLYIFFYLHLCSHNWLERILKWSCVLVNWHWMKMKTWHIYIYKKKVLKHFRLCTSLHFALFFNLFKKANFCSWNECLKIILRLISAQVSQEKRIPRLTLLWGIWYCIATSVRSLTTKNISFWSAD